MKRKIIQLSTSTKVISLPSSWIKKNNLKKGTELEMCEKDNMLIVSKDADTSKKQSSIDISGINPDLIWMILDGLYISGFDDITVKTSSQKQRDTFTRASKDFPGLIIYEEKGEIIRLKNISLQEEFDISQIISRIRNITITMIDDCIEAAKGKNWEVLAGIKKRDYIINTYVSLAFRHLNKYGYESTSKLGVVSQHIKLLEIFSDRLCNLFIEMAKQKEATKGQKTLVVSIREMYREESVLISKLTIQKLSEFDVKRIKLQNIASKEEGIIGNEIMELINLFYEIEEMAVQMNAGTLSK